MTWVKGAEVNYTPAGVALALQDFPLFIRGILWNADKVKALSIYDFTNLVETGNVHCARAVIDKNGGPGNANDP